MTDPSQPTGWISPQALVPPLRFSIKTTLSPDAAAAALATAIHEKRYADPRAVACAFLRLTGTVTGPRIDLGVKLYVLPGIPARGQGPRLRGDIVARPGGSELVAELVPADDFLESLPLIGPLLVGSTRRGLAAEGEVLQRFLAEVLRG
jgi:hypothetical protein